MLTKSQIRHLKSLAQRLDPVLAVGKDGLSDAFLIEVRARLKALELIKIRLASFQDERKTIAAALAEKTESQLVTVVGHVFVLYKANESAVEPKVHLPA
jgi:RNA-binding protein